jgi:hypothetical protein
VDNDSMFVREKSARGHTYLYLVENEREGGRIRQRIIRALGRKDGGAPGPARHQECAPRQLARLPDDRVNWLLAAGTLGAVILFGSSDALGGA